MKRTLLAATALALAATSTMALARSGDMWSGTNVHREYAPIEVTTLQPGDTVIVQGTSSVSTPVLVERAYVSEPAYVYYYEPTYVYRHHTADNDWVKDLNPETGQRIGDGLFNRTGPNDFGH
jgi:hypothetical protein